MRQLTAIVLFIATAFAAPIAERAPQREIDNVAAFARLYGVVRYFYPTDAAAALDWNGFAVHGVSQVRVASELKGLETTLNRLVSPLGSGIVIARTLPPAPASGSSDGALVAWRYYGAAVTADGSQNVYRAKRTNRPLQTSQDGGSFATVMQNVPALPLRGKTVRLRGLVRTETPGDAASGAALWLRVDRAGGQAGFFDNMGNRPVRVQEWRQYDIEGQVADDATNVAFGMMAVGSLTAEFEAIGLSVRDESGAWTPVDIRDPGFEDSPDNAGGWFQAGTSKTAMITRPTDKAPEGRQFLRIAAPAATTVSRAEIFDAPHPVTGAHADVDLGMGLHARVPLALSEPQAAGGMNDASQLEALRKAIAAVAPSSRDPLEVDVRLADVVVAWNVFRHFYPYWSEAQVDWDARLKPQLAAAYDAPTRDAHRDALRLLVADLRDGHGNVIDTRSTGGRASVPIRLRAIGGQLVVTATAAQSEVPAGAVVTAIDGVSAEQRLAEALRLASGSSQWKEARAEQEIVTCRTGATVTLAIDSGTGPRQIRLPCEAKQPPPEQRPTAVAELAPGIWYVDLTRAQMTEVTPALSKLAHATGVVFDVRGSRPMRARSCFRICLTRRRPTDGCT